MKYKMEDQKKQEYGLYMAEVEREKHKKQKLLDHKEEKTIEFRHRIDEVINPPGLLNYNNYIEFLKEEAKQQDKIILEAQKKAEKKRQELVESMKERKTLEKLSERQYEVFLIEQKLAEQRVADEMMSYRFDNRDAEET